MPQVILYNYFRSSTSYRVRIALHLKNIAFEYKAIPLLENAQKTPEYLKLNPQGEVPTLVYNGKSIAQSLPILEFLDEVQTQAPLFPKDPFEKAVVRQFCENINSYLHPLSNLKVLQYLEKKHNYSTEEKEAWIAHWYGPGLQALEQMAEKHSGKYCFGDEISAADLCLIPALFTARRFKVPTDEFVLLNSIDQFCSENLAFKKAHPMAQIDTPK